MLQNTNNAVTGEKSLKKKIFLLKRIIITVFIVLPVFSPKNRS